VALVLGLVIVDTVDFGFDAAGPTTWQVSVTSDITDDELEALALAGDPDLPPDPSATPLELGNPGAHGLLPGWYMPPAVARVGGWRSRVIVALVLAFLLIEIAGLCFTYGPVLP
jgi:hypothetical protein